MSLNSNLINIRRQLKKERKKKKESPRKKMNVFWQQSKRSSITFKLCFFLELVQKRKQVQRKVKVPMKKVTILFMNVQV